MISFTDMLETDFADYLSCFISEYSAEIAQNYKVPQRSAAQIAAKEIANDLPDGTNTVGQFLFRINTVSNDEKIHIGYLWYSRNDSADGIFICDFQILTPYQDQGFGQLALAALDNHLSGIGVTELRLRVAIENRVAQHVYEACGFRKTGINMFESIGARQAH